jgi:hypothetical protein
MLGSSTTAAGLLALSMLMAPILAGAQEEDDGIDIGGAVRLQWSYEDYNEGNRERGGDLDFDTFRLNLDGSIDDVLLSAEWRYYQYMQVIHHAWVGYRFDNDWQAELGITQVPFGNLPFNSHGFFFSSNYYLGLEDDYDAGLKFQRTTGNWDLRLAFFKNDELGGVDGFVNDRAERYSFDVVAQGLTAQGGLQQPIGATNGERNERVNLNVGYYF